MQFVDQDAVIIQMLIDLEWVNFFAALSKALQILGDLIKALSEYFCIEIEIQSGRYFDAQAHGAIEYERTKVDLKEFTEAVRLVGLVQV